MTKININENDNTRRVSTLLLITASVLVLIGLGAWIYQLVQGMKVTGIGQRIVWGAYIAGFFTAAGGGAGLLALVGLREFLDSLRSVERNRALCLSIISFIAGGILVIVDLGSPSKLWKMVFAGEFSSMMTWDFWLLLLALIIAVVYLVKGQNEKRMPLMGVIAIASAAALVAVEAWMLSVLKAEPAWGGGMTLVSFLFGAALAGLGLAMIIMPFNTEIKKWMKVVLWINLIVVLAEVLTGLITGSEETEMILAGSAASGFWFHLLLGLLLPLGLLLADKDARFIGGLAVLGILAEKMWLLEAGQAFSLLTSAGSSYTASWIEYLVLIGIIGLGTAFYLLTLRLNISRCNSS